MPILDKIFGKGGSELTKNIGDVVDNISTSDQEKLNAKNKLTQIVTNSVNEEVKHQKDIIVTEMSGNWLQRSWRPLIMLAFGTVIIFSALYPVHLNTVPDKFWDLMITGITMGVGGRTLEKVVNNATRNMDITFLRKKDRK